MLKWKHCCLFFLILCIGFSSLKVSAESPIILIQLTIGSQAAMVNGKQTKLDVPPMIMNGRTLVPIRFISEALGAEVAFDAATRTITIQAPDGKALLSLDQENKATIQSLEEQISALKKQLESDSKELKSESDPPVIYCNNLTENAIISEITSLDLVITDSSPIAYVQSRLGNVSLFNTSSKYGLIEPAKYCSGKYTLLIEAWDAFGNRGELSLQVIIQNGNTKEPLVFKTEVREITRMGSGGPPGGGGGGGQPPPGDRTTQIPLSLLVSLENNSISWIELTNIQVFDALGNLKQNRSDLSTIDMVKTQTGFTRLNIMPAGSFSAQVAMALLDEGAKKEDLFKGWKVELTLFDSTMQKELTKTIIIS